MSGRVWFDSLDVDPHDWGVTRDELAAAVTAPDEHLNPSPREDKDGTP